MDLARNSGDADSSELLAAQAHIWNHIFNFIISMSLKCAVQLGIPDIIHTHGHPMTLDHLIHALPISHEKSQFVYRLMRILIHSGIFVKEKISETDEEEGYALTPSSKLLLKDSPLSMERYLLAMLDPLMVNTWHKLSQWFQNSDESPFYTCNGRKFWELLGVEPLLNNFFNEGMASDARMVINVVIKTCKDVFLGLNSVVDVGGGTGTLAQAIADAFPHLKCSVLDLPQVVDGLKSCENLAYVAGDMFEAIPPADAVLLKWILHDWSDKECVEILKNCKAAIPSREKGGQMIILDMVIMKDQHEYEEIETQLFFDMLMMVTLTGKERNEEEWAKLFFEAGFNDYKITPVLGLRSVIQMVWAIRPPPKEKGSKPTKSRGFVVSQ